MKRNKNRNFFHHASTLRYYQIKLLLQYKFNWQKSSKLEKYISITSRFTYHIHTSLDKLQTLYNNLYPLYFLLHPSSYQLSTKTKPPSIFHLPIHYPKLDKITLKLPNYGITTIRINPAIPFFFTIHAIGKQAILSFEDLSVLKFHGWHRDVLITRQSECEPPPG